LRLVEKNHRRPLRLALLHHDGGDGTVSRSNLDLHPHRLLEINLGSSDPVACSRDQAQAQQFRTRANHQPIPLRINLRDVKRFPISHAEPLPLSDGITKNSAVSAQTTPVGQLNSTRSVSVLQYRQ